MKGKSEYNNAFYEYLAEVMVKHSDIAPNIISPKKARYVIARYGIPKILWNTMIEEMVEARVLRKINIREIEIIKPGTYWLTKIEECGYKDLENDNPMLKS